MILDTKFRLFASYFRKFQKLGHRRKFAADLIYRGHSQQVERAENRFYFVVSAAHRLQTSRVVLCGYKETLGNNRRLKWWSFSENIDILTKTPYISFAKLLEHRTGIAEVMGTNPVGASGFFLGFICNYSSLILHNCEDLFLYSLSAVHSRRAHWNQSPYFSKEKRSRNFDFFLEMSLRKK